MSPMMFTALALLPWGTIHAAPAQPAEAPPRPPGEVGMIILGGGKTPEAAEAWRRKQAGALRELSKSVVLPTGHPKQLASSSVAGLNPGFQIVVGGICEPAEAERVLTLIKRHIPDAYVRPVKVPDDQVVCPSLASPVALVTFHDDGRRCRILRTAPGEDPQAWGSVPGQCPKTTWDVVSATRTPEGRVVIGTPTGAVERTYDGKVRELPALPEPWALDWAGLDLDGSVLAAGRFTGPDAGAEKRSRWVIDGRAVEFEWEAGAKGAVLCGVFTLGSAGWSRSALRPRGLQPGAGGLSCPAPALGVDARIPLGRPGSGAPGQSWPPATGGPVDGLVEIDGPFAAKSLGGWLEGPLYFTGATPWVRIEGFEARAPLALQVVEDVAIACTSGRSAVIALSDGAVGWTSTACPIVWDQ
jgi:hypothetical protein